MSTALKNNASQGHLIYKKMIDIMCEIGPISKDQTNTHQKFKFRGIDQFVNALHPALAKHKVFMAPRCISTSHEMREVKRSSGHVGLDKHVHLQMEYTFFAEDGSSVVIGPIAAEGLDSGDKATGKALSAALKYALIQTFSIPTEDMAEGDLDSPENLPPSKKAMEAAIHAIRPKEPWMDPNLVPDLEEVITGEIDQGPPPGHPAYQASPVAKSDYRRPTDKQLKRLYAIRTKVNVSDRVMLDYVKKTWGRNSDKDLEVTEYDQLCDMLEGGTFPPLAEAKPVGSSFFKHPHPGLQDEKYVK